MFSFFEKVEAKYEKLFFELNIKSINGESLDLNQFKGKAVLLVDLQNNIQNCKNYMIYTKTRV